MSDVVDVRRAGVCVEFVDVCGGDPTAANCDSGQKLCGHTDRRDGWNSADYSFPDPRGKNWGADSTWNPLVIVLCMQDETAWTRYHGRLPADRRTIAAAAINQRVRPSKQMHDARSIR